MYELSQYAFVASFAALGLALFLYLANLVGARSVRLIGAANGGSISTSTALGAVDSASAQKQMSAICSSLLPAVPVKAITLAFFSFAISTAAMIFAEVPLVEKAHRMSSSRTSASACLAKTLS